MIWCAACGGYLLFAGSAASRDELITAALLATGATAWAAGIRHCGRQRFALSIEHAREWARAIVALGPAITRTFPVFAKAALLGRARGRLLEIPFQRGAEGSARDAARRASALLIGSLGPDSFVVRARPRRDRVLIHAIPSGEGRRDPRWLNL